MNVSQSSVPGFRAWAVSDRGLLRSENQDAWAVLWDQEADDGPCHVFAVFDGVGGLPHGAVAARTAAESLAARLGTGPVDGLLARMNEDVRETGGGTTAVIAIASASDPGSVEVLSVGDSSAYRLSGSGELESVAPRDAGRGNEIRDFLGNPALSGHRVHVDLSGAASLLLCTDGVDKVVGAHVLAEVLTTAPDDARGALEALLDAVRDRGAPDNATVVLVRRVS